ncbi:hypothetical protein [Altererythrobacter aquiaggeris]
MGLFASDLYRNFAIGFTAGAIAVAAQMGPNMIPEAAIRAIASILG